MVGRVSRICHTQPSIVAGCHTLVDALGNPLGFFLTGGEAHDLVGADHLLPTMEANMLIADKAFDADERVLKPLAATGKTAVIPPRANRSPLRDYDRQRYGEPPSDRELLRQDQAVPCDRYPLREDRAQLPGRRPSRRQRRLAQLTTRPRHATRSRPTQELVASVYRIWQRHRRQARARRRSARLI